MAPGESSRHQESLVGIALEERVSTALASDSGRWSVAGIDDGLVRQNHEFFVNAFHEAFMAHARKVGSADARIEQSVAAEDHSMSREANTS